MSKNANKEHKDKLSFVDRVALKITKFVGTMWCALLFTLLALVSLPEAIRSNDPVIIVSWIAQTFLQLVLLSVIMIGQDLANRHAEIRAELDFETNIKAEKEIELIQKQLTKIEKLCKKK
jgi:uncharacterized membrane protein